MPDPNLRIPLSRRFCADTGPSKAALDAGLAAYREWFSSQPTLSPYACCPPDVPVKAAHAVIRAEMVAEVHVPRRDDDVAAWLQRMRDKRQSDSIVHQVIDVLLDRYRECADYGLTLRPEDDQRGDQ